MRRPAFPTVLAACWTALVTVAILWPMGRGGYPLGRDMVFTPHQPLTAASIGLGSGSPRAVPLDALVSMASQLLGGALVGRLALAIPLLAAGLGAARLLDAIRTGRAAVNSGPALAGSLAVAGLAVWNPFVIERLALGQWAVLWAYGALPWLVVISRRIRAGRSSWLDWSAAFVALAAAAITPTGAVLGALSFAVLVWSGRDRCSLFGVVAAALVQLPWLVPALLSSAAATSDPRAVTVFASRAERWGGAFGSLLGLGGIWDRGSMPDSRTGALGYLTTIVVIGALIVGGRALWSRVDRLRIERLRIDRSMLTRLGALALLGFVFAVAASTPLGAAVLRWATGHLPGAGLLRDGQKWLIPFVLLAVLCVGAAVEQVAERGRAVAVVSGCLGLVLPLLLLPDAISTVRPTLTPARYPVGWYEASRAVNGPGDVLVLPFASYRKFDWDTASSVIDPAPRWLSAEAVVNDQLVVSGQVLAGEDRRAAEIGQLLQGGNGLAARLAADGIGWVWVEQDTAEPAVPDLSGLQRVVSSDSVELYRVPGSIAVRSVSTYRRVAVISVDLLVLILVLGSVIVLGTTGVRACYTRR